MGGRGFEKSEKWLKKIGKRMNRGSGPEISYYKTHRRGSVTAKNILF